MHSIGAVPISKMNNVGTPMFYYLLSVWSRGEGAKELSVWDDNV